MSGRPPGLSDAASEPMAGDGAKRAWRAGEALAALAAAFALAFVALVVWLALDQRVVLESSARLNAETVPRTLEHFRLARNLEQLRFEGERALAAARPEDRRQALFIVSLLVNHPAMGDDARVRPLVVEVERFLIDLPMRPGTDERARWNALAFRLTELADVVSVAGVNLANDDLQAMTHVMRRGRIKLFVVLAVVAAFGFGSLLLIRRQLIAPLQRMRRFLLALHAGEPASPLPAAAIEEIGAVQGAIAQLQGAMQDNERARAELERLATTDALTGLPNRNQFVAMASAELARARRYGRPVTIGIADLDHFKRINDGFGHAAGDAALQCFARQIVQTLRQSDGACRYGGEEFAFVFPDTAPADAAALAERLRGALAETAHPQADGRSFNVTLSMGLADASDGLLEPALARADRALYEAKALGRDRIVVG